MIKPTDGGCYILRLQNDLECLFISIVEKALNDLGYKCATMTHLTRTLGDRRKIPKDQYYAMTRETSYDSHGAATHSPACVSLEDATIKFYPHFEPENHEIELIPLRGNTGKAENIAKHIKREIRNRNQLYREWVKRSGKIDSREDVEALLKIGFPVSEIVEKFGTTYKGSLEFYKMFPGIVPQVPAFDD